MRLTLLKLALYIVIALHYLLFIMLISSIPMLFLFEPWYVSTPLVVWLINLMTLPVKCPLTTLENVIRRLLGMTTIKGFVSKHILFRDR
jgi:hypothetical protein